MKRRVVITGLGVVAPNGIGKEAFWQATISGRSGVRRITRFDASSLGTQIAGEVVDFSPEHLGLTPNEILHLDRGTQFGLASANLALQDANLPALDEDERERMGVYVGSAMASSEQGEKLWLQITNHGLQSHFETVPDIRRASINLLRGLIPSNSIASHHHLHGPCTVISTGCSAGGDAIGEAFWAIQDDRADRMLAGGTDSSISYSGLNAFCVIKAVSTRNDEPERASRPYDAQRDGFVLAEGAGMLLLEERSLALARGAHIYAEVIAFSSTSNAHHMTSLPEDGSPLRQLLEQVLAEANLSATHLHYINSHGSSTPSNEPAETAAYKAAFGKQAYHIPISSTKSMIGHTQGAASAIETLVTALAIEHQILPPTINQEYPDPRCDLDYVPNVARPSRVEVALTHSSGFGGVNSALILAKANWSDSNV